MGGWIRESLTFYGKAIDGVLSSIGYEKKGMGSGTVEVKQEITPTPKEVLVPLNELTFFLKIGGFSCSVAILMAIYGVYDPRNNLQHRQIYVMGIISHLALSAALAISDKCNNPPLTGGLFSLGILLFSGGCYAHGLTGNSKFGKISLVGSGVLISAWCSMFMLWKE